MKRTAHYHFLSLMLLLLISLQLTAQAKSYKVQAEQEILYEPDATLKGASGKITARIIYDVYFGEPTIKALAGKFQLGDYFYYNKQRYPSATLPPEIRTKIRLSLTDVCYDISSAGRVVVANICKKNLMDWDMSASPNWKDIFPGLSAEQAKDLYKTGFSITNIRITGVSMNFPYDIEKYLKGAHGSNTPAGSQPANIPWEAVRYYRTADSIFIYHNNGMIEKFRTCGNPVVDNSSGSQSGANTDVSNIYAGIRLLSPFYDGSAIVWGIPVTDNKWKITERNSLTFKEVTKDVYDKMRTASLLAADKLDGDWDEPVTGNSARARLTPKYPTLPMQVHPESVVRQKPAPDYLRMIILRIFDGTRYVNGIRKPSGQWQFMESNGFIFETGEKTYNEMIGRQREDIRY